MIQQLTGSTRKKNLFIPPATQAALALAGLLLLCGGSPANAEQLKTPIMQQGGESVADMPSHGQNKAAVKARFGEPQTVKGPIGDPPITQWYYADFVVYFEYDHVIHSVAKPNR